MQGRHEGEGVRGIEGAEARRPGKRWGTPRNFSPFFGGRGRLGRHFPPSANPCGDGPVYMGLNYYSW